MIRGSRVLAALALSAITVCGGASAASASGGEEIVGSVLSVVGSSSSTGHANQCGAPIAGVGVKSACGARHVHRGGERPGGERVTGGPASNVASWNATGHSNNCGNPNGGVFAESTCTTEDIEHGH
ncbi:hypothetical protein [Streptomyces caatingaensis]|uniref:Chaplin domain-containing protein n=1 Tax=Streptomyces caatingaensis TaxID=1678637 RepID=A0A0K9XKR8_9ACTN|nr:hypothetical protein [Streptomyces caatingaensis]KNB53247.1 hypothetical protein AC230_07340 [Streptomyces caatingaensis]